MNCTDRRKELLNWLDREGSLSTRQIAERFKVTKMTVHRDLLLLEKRQALRRIHGGVLAIPKPVEPAEPFRTGLPVSTQNQCLICFRTATQHLLYSLTLSNGESKQACCPHCGISAHLLYKEQVVMALAADYLTGRQHPARSSCFLLGSVAAPCCRPSILTFEREDMASRFQAGFGGTLGDLDDAIAFLQQELSLDHGKKICPKCSSGQATTSLNGPAKA